jgi:hypothetical protein
MINFICLKWGTKYDAEYVNRMYTMIKRNCDVEFLLHCCTEDSTGIREEVNIIPLSGDLHLETYWWKLWIISNQFPVRGKCIFFDLDIVIQNNLKEVIEYRCADKLYILSAKWKKGHITDLEYNIKFTSTNSSVMLWNSSIRLDTAFDKFMSDPEFYMMKYVGNDNYLEYECQGTCNTLPTDWVYCRLWGYDYTIAFEEERKYHTQYLYKDLRGNTFQLYYMPERMICMFNGIGDYTNSSGYYIDSKVYDGFEFYWSD